MGRPAIIGNHVYFLAVGKDIDGVTIASNAKPDDDPVTNWTSFKLGCVEEASINNDIQTEEVKCPVEDKGDGTPGGSYQTVDEFVTEQNLSLNLTLAELNPTAWRIMWMSGEILPTSGNNGPFTPLSAGAFVKGWSRIAQYDESNILISTVDVFCQLRLNGSVNFNSSVTKVPLTLKVFSNPLNSGTLHSIFT